MANDSEEEAVKVARACIAELEWMIRALTEEGLFYPSSRLMVDGHVVPKRSRVAVTRAPMSEDHRKQLSQLRAELTGRIRNAHLALSGTLTDSDRARAVREELALSGKKLREFLAEEAGPNVKEEMVEATIRAIASRDPELWPRLQASRAEIANALVVHDENRGGRGNRPMESAEEATVSVLTKLGLNRNPPRRQAT